MISIQRGVEWLDANAPKDWRQRINFDTLNIRIWGNCILGQVFGMKNLVLNYPKELGQYGFFATNDEDNKFLIQEWRTVCSQS